MVEKIKHTDTNELVWCHFPGAPDGYHHGFLGLTQAAADKRDADYIAKHPELIRKLDK